MPAHRATGPRTAQGKAASSQNALRHGLLSDAPLATPFELPEAWQAHRTAILHDLAPHTYLESILAERIALLHWRLARVARYEVARIAKDQQQLRLDNAERRFGTPGAPTTMAGLQAARAARRRPLDLLQDWPDLDDDAPLPAGTVREMLAAVLAPLGPLDTIVRLLRGARSAEDLAAYCARQRWTLRRLEEALEPLCDTYGTTVTDLHAAALQQAEDACSTLTRARSDEEIAVLEGAHGLPDLADVERLARYEAHLSRELARASHQLDELQAQRRAAAATENCETKSPPPGSPERENCETKSPPTGLLPTEKRVATSPPAGLPQAQNGHATGDDRAGSSPLETCETKSPPAGYPPTEKCETNPASLPADPSHLPPAATPAPGKTPAPGRLPWAHAPVGACPDPVCAAHDPGFQPPSGRDLVPVSRTPDTRL